MTDEKPIFVPLIAKWFDAFKDGSKTWEHRMLRRQWNADQVRVGRRVTLSRGYGKHQRLHGVIIDVEVQLACELADYSLYPDASPDTQFISFKIKLD